ncbi:MAG: hypothetical protein QNK30_11690 [Bacteroidales bacterium]|nr:hypothetical protein [Bacteroidales bacterium]
MNEKKGHIPASPKNLISQDYSYLEIMKKSTFAVLFTCLLFSFFHPVYCQTYCKVLKPEISLDYQGECKKDLAHGQGEAFGRDHYIGEFKKGWPNGMGLYEWNNGDSYEGEWKTGERHGNGKFTFTISTEILILEGRWANDEFVGRKNGYKIEERSNISFSIRRIGLGNKVSFRLPTVKDPNRRIHNMLIISSSGKEVRNDILVGFEDLSFPVTLSLSYYLENKLKSQEIPASLRITFYEPGEYEIIIYDKPWGYL